MAQVVRIKRRVGSAGEPSTLAAGELAYNDTGTVHNLYVGNGSAVNPLVSNQRQVELAGNQTITGEKTISVDALKITGGANGNVIKTDGAGNLEFAQGTVSVGDSLTGTGVSSDPLDLLPATTIQIKAGLDDVNAVTAHGLRSQMGEDAADLDTTAKTIVPAINELMSAVVAMTGVIILIGTYDAAGDEVTPGAGSPFGDTAGPLPAASADNLGWYLIVDTAGAGSGNAPSGSIAMGDWLLSNGEEWLHFEMNLGVIAASNVSVTALDSSSAATVQEALEELYAGGVLEVAVDGVSITGNGQTATPLVVGEIDGGTYT